MMNPLTNVVPQTVTQTGGRAFFSARPATASPDEAAGAARFGEVLRLAQIAVPGSVEAPDTELATAEQESKSGTGCADDQSGSHSGNHPGNGPDNCPGHPAHRQANHALDDQQLSELPGIAPIAAPPVPVAIVPVEVSTGTEAPLAASVSIVAVPTASGIAPATAVPGMVNDSALFERGRGASRAGGNAALFTMNAADESSDSKLAASTSALTATTTARGSAVHDAAAGGAQRAIAMLASQSQSQAQSLAQSHAHSQALSLAHSNSMVALPVPGSEPLAANAAGQPGAAARQPLAALLGERLHVQINQRSEHAVIRLDPPSMGSIEIVIRHEAGAVQIQLRASNSEVARQLHTMGDTLRQDLVQRQHGDVSVQVWDGSRDADGRQRHRPAAPWQDDPGRALSDAGESHESAAFALNAE